MDISILETIELLDNSLSDFADGIADDRYAIWLGAGVSLGKLPGLKGVVAAVLEHLRLKVDHANHDCVFRACLNDILALVALDAPQRASLDFATPVETWGPINQIKQQLIDRYAVMLDQFPASEDLDYLVWEGVKVAERYADPATSPGPEHLGLSALIMEGVASDCASANWDDLIEKAIRVLDGPGSTVMQVRVLPKDVQDNVRRARLYKFHGCAALAGQNEAVYRQRIVGRQSQIDGWAAKPENIVIAAKLLDLAVSKCTLMLGLSAQDTNIQDVFVRAHAQLPSSFPTQPPAVMISEDQVGVRQRTLLQNFYRNDYQGQSGAIHTASLIRSFPSTLLPALWLHVVCAKAKALANTAVDNLPKDDREELRRGLERLRDLAASTATVGNHESFMLDALSHFGRATRLFYRGRSHYPGQGIYAPLSDTGITRTLANPHLESTGQAELALGLAIIGYGETKGNWVCSMSDIADPKSGALQVESLAVRSQVFFAGSAHAAAQLFAEGHVSDHDDAVIVHSFAPPSRAPRHPTSAPGRTGKTRLREVSIPSVKDGAPSVSALLQKFKMEAAL
ncbi:SIR2 family protein [Thioclava sp. FR2]|uniref:SIR2 family protein n=1 Tax=Thioclava sp. FR2 TaxID=3445780 RepID=UPI003EBC3862